MQSLDTQLAPTPKFNHLVPTYDRQALKGEAFLCDLSALNSSDYRDVYEPDEDTYLLIDALNMESRNTLKQAFKPDEAVHLLEIGVGSGAVINSLQMIMERDGIIDKANLSNFKFLGTDVNAKAIDCAQRVSAQNNTKVDYKLDNFADSLVQNAEFHELFDVIIFNPPYVVTSEEELVDAQDKKGIEASWAGGKDGIEVLMKAIPCINQLLNPKKGMFYLLLIEENLKILPILQQQYNFKYVVVMKREVLCENQLVVRLTKF